MDTTICKGTGKRAFYVTVIALASSALFVYFAFQIGTFMLGTLGNGSGASDSVKISLTVGLVLFFLGLATLGFFVLKRSQTIYYYEDGFTIGQNGEKISYQNLQYHLVPGTLPNRFIGIYYRDNNGKLAFLNAKLYQSKAFDLFQKDVTAINLAQDLDKIEKGETIRFKAKNPTKRVMNAVKAIEDGIEVGINKTGISFDDEKYTWIDYDILCEYLGIIVIRDKKTNKTVLSFKNSYLIEQPNVVAGLIHILGED